MQKSKYDFFMMPEKILEAVANLVNSDHPGNCDEYDAGGDS